MWTCPRCERRFNKDNQSHYCTTKSIDELFEGKAEHLLLAFDKVLVDVYDFGEMSIGASVNTVIFTNRKAFLIVRPMSKLLDLKFYSDELHKSAKIHKSGPWAKKFYHHIRVKEAEEIDDEVIGLLKKGYDFGMKK